MLRESGWIWVALGVSVLGIFLLAGYADSVQPEQVTIHEIEPGMRGQTVLIQARAKNITFHSASLFFDLWDGNRIAAIYSNPELGQLALVQENAQLKVRGKLQRYKGKLEIQVEDVSMLD